MGYWALWDWIIGQFASTIYCRCNDMETAAGLEDFKVESLGGKTAELLFTLSQLGPGRRGSMVAGRSDTAGELLFRV